MKNRKPPLSRIVQLAIIALPIVLASAALAQTPLPRRSQAEARSLPDGWFIPEARWLELRQALSDKIETLEKPR